MHNARVVVIHRTSRRVVARAMSTTVTLRCDFACDGCANAVKRILSKDDAVTSVRTSVEDKLVVVVGAGLDAEDVRARVSKCGRETTVVSAVRSSA